METKVFLELASEIRAVEITSAKGTIWTTMHKKAHVRATNYENRQPA